MTCFLSKADPAFDWLCNWIKATDWLMVPNFKTFCRLLKQRLLHLLSFVSKVKMGAYQYLVSLTLGTICQPVSG